MAGVVIRLPLAVVGRSLRCAMLIVVSWGLVGMKRRLRQARQLRWMLPQSRGKPGLI